MSHQHTTTTAKAAPAFAKGQPELFRAGDRVVVVGAGASGVAAAKLLAAMNAQVVLLEKNEQGVSTEIREELKQYGVALECGEHSPAQFAEAKLVVTSPGIPLTKITTLLTPQAGTNALPPLVAEMELALCCVTEPILAVTGTSGKTTTVSLAADMLRQAGKRVFLGGNIGTPLSDYVLEARRTPEKAADVLVLEMSSFQLQGSEHLKPKAAILLNLSPNHLDHHKDMAEYTDAKFRIFAHQDAGDTAVIPEALAEEYTKRGCRGRLVTFTEGKRFAHTKLIGRHNLANAEAAFLAAREFGVSEEDAAKAVAAFTPLRHRLEYAGEKNGVTFVNDSKCTTVDAMHAALTSFDTPVILLAGGKFKGGDLASLIPLLRERVKAVALFGASREIFEEAWQGAVPMTWSEKLPEALAQAEKAAVPGDVVLLSPATASYDLYSNYKERGDHFCSLVNA